VQYRTIGTTTLNLSRVGIGSWVFGGASGGHGWGAQDDKASLATLHKAFESGVNWVDTAPAYGLGHAEIVVGKAIRASTAEIMIASKCGLVWRDGESQAKSDLKSESIREQAEQSLRRLGIEVLDLYQIHWPRPRTDLEEAWETIGELVKEGKVRYAGVCNCSLAQLQRLNSIHPVMTLQAAYNPIERGIESQLLQHCIDGRIGVMTYRPLYAGLLSGKFNAARAGALPDDDWRTREPNFHPPLLATNLEFADAFGGIADRLGTTPSTLAVNWNLGGAGIDVCIVGARTPVQLLESLQELSLTSEVVAEISALAASRDAAARMLRSNRR
jgi:aryl-alcohol dehydrogenase-like predicted oxidoreductase